jgi:hypothetical protein
VLVLTLLLRTSDFADGTSGQSLADSAEASTSTHIFPMQLQEVGFASHCA